ncbi:MAG TPA: response regulator, partial [Opitutales bacterium]|nr:response regulator [Opitutales bacterium]
TKEFGKGTGLGLSTALMIVKGYGGVINLQSELGRGTTFGVYLPVAQTADQNEAGSQPVQTAKGESLRGKNECILLVDDESAIRQVTAQILTRFGYRVCTASNGAEAVDLYRKKGEGISLVLTDLAMPVMDGAKMISVLRRLDPEVRIVASSGLVTVDHYGESLAENIADFVAKPYTVERLLSSIRNVLESK